MRYVFLISTLVIVSGCATLFDPIYNFHPQEKQSFGKKRMPNENSQLQQEYGFEPAQKEETVTYTWLNRSVEIKRGMSENVVSHHYYNENKDSPKGVKPLLNRDYSSIRRDIVFEYSDKEIGTNFFDLADPLSQPNADGIDYSETIDSMPYNMKDPKTHEFIDDYHTPSYQKGTADDLHTRYDEFLHSEIDDLTDIAKRDVFYNEKPWKHLGDNKLQYQ